MGGCCRSCFQKTHSARSREGFSSGKDACGLPHLHLPLAGNPCSCGPYGLLPRCDQLYAVHPALNEALPSESSVFLSGFLISAASYRLREQLKSSCTRKSLSYSNIVLRPRGVVAVC